MVVQMKRKNRPFSHTQDVKKQPECRFGVDCRVYYYRNTDRSPDLTKNKTGFYQNVLIGSVILPEACFFLLDDESKTGNNDGDQRGYVVYQEIIHDAGTLNEI